MGLSQAKECSRQREVYVFKDIARGWRKAKNLAQGVKRSGWLEHNEQEKAKSGQVSKVTFPVLKDTRNQN